jgi:diguanylate cyclase (GGDEF)-like protein
MNALKEGDNFQLYDVNTVILAFISVIALAAALLAANTNLNFSVKLSIYVTEIILYLTICALFYFRPRPKIFAERKIVQPETIFTDNVKEKLLALEEAHRFFGSSLKSADMFRLAASRLNELIPFAACVYFDADAENSRLHSRFAVGVNSKEFSELELNINQGLAGKTFLTGKVQIDEGLMEDKENGPDKALENLNAGIAVPLRRNGRIFGVMVLYGDRKNQYNRNSAALLEAAAVRLAPLFKSSQAFETSLNNALTDSLTGMPNERAFYLVLENQIAQTQRNSRERPLTILGIDIRNFDELNRQFGHSAGDRILYYAAETIKNQLRQMDFLARTTGDEFLAVLPTASEEVAREIVERIGKAFLQNPFEISPTNKVTLNLNFGAASFGSVGETAAALIKHARLKKQQTKSVENKSNLLWFSKKSGN